MSRGKRFHNLGRLGEKKAGELLRRQGFRTVVSNYRCRLGEIDLVAMEGETVVFVEVKSKTGSFHGRPEEMLTAAKRRRLTMLARFFLARKGWERRPARFDVVTIDWEQAGKGSVKHYRDAFPASSPW
jgi:putative endonuclease